ncbi:hypothetical protein B4Q13_22505, partial [Lacticaseibacillus rhamnosus]
DRVQEPVALSREKARLDRPESREHKADTDDEHGRDEHEHPGIVGGRLERHVEDHEEQHDVVDPSDRQQLSATRHAPRESFPAPPRRAPRC